MSEYIQNLNPTQRDAAVNYQGASLIIAGAGSGKTRVLTCRIAYMLSQGVQAHTVLALTFTNKAAKEMRERIATLVPGGMSRSLWMGPLPLGFRPHPARRIRQAGLPVVVHDLRFGRREKPREARDQGAEPLGRDLQAERRRGPNLEGEKQPGHAAGLRGEQFAAGRRPRAADSAVPRHLQTVRAQMPRERRDGLRRPAAEHEYPDARLPGGTHEVPEPVPLHSRGRVPGHQLRAVRHHPAARRVARQRLRGGRRRAEHLLVPRREDREYPALPAGLSRRKAFQTGTELPFDTDDRQRRELRDREEPAPDPQKILLGRRRGRPDPCDQGLHRQRGVGAARVGHLHDRPHPRGTVQRRGRTLPHQRAVARAGRGAAQPQHPL